MFPALVLHNHNVFVKVMLSEYTPQKYFWLFQLSTLILWFTHVGFERHLRKKWTELNRCFPWAFKGHSSPSSFIMSHCETAVRRACFVSSVLYEPGECVYYICLSSGIQLRMSLTMNFFNSRFVFFFTCYKNSFFPPYNYTVLGF